MPLEGHWRRVNVPLGRRERLVVIVGVAVTVLAIVAAILATAGRSRPEPGPGCIRASIAGVMGGSELNLCGEHAKRYCAQHAVGGDPNSAAIRASCRDAGLLR